MDYASTKPSKTQGPHWLTGPPGWIYAALTIFVGVMTLHMASWPVRIPCWIVLGIPLVGWYLLRAIVSLAVRGSAEVRSGRRYMWFIIPVWVGIIIVALALHVPLRVRFAMSRAALETEARRLLATPATEADMHGPGPARFFSLGTVGYYDVGLADVDYESGHVFFSIGFGIRPNGLVYCQNGAVSPQMGWRVWYLPENWGLFAYP